MREDKSRKQRKRQVRRLENLELSPISLAAKLANDIALLVVERQNPEEQEEVPMPKRKVKDEESI